MRVWEGWDRRVGFGWSIAECESRGRYCVYVHIEPLSMGPSDPLTVPQPSFLPPSIIPLDSSLPASDFSNIRTEFLPALTHPRTPSPILDHRRTSGSSYLCPRIANWLFECLHPCLLPLFLIPIENRKRLPEFFEYLNLTHLCLRIYLSIYARLRNKHWGKGA